MAPGQDGCVDIKSEWTMHSASNKTAHIIFEWTMHSTSLYGRLYDVYCMSDTFLIHLSVYLLFVVCYIMAV